MTYEEFLKFVPSKCMYETIYDDGEGRTILVIKLLDAFSMVNKAQRTWVGLTDDDKVLIKHDANYNQFMTAGEYADLVQALTEARLKDKNT
jgi:hypothetical protein